MRKKFAERMRISAQTGAPGQGGVAIEVLSLEFALKTIIKMAPAQKSSDVIRSEQIDNKDEQAQSE